MRGIGAGVPASPPRARGQLAAAVLIWAVVGVRPGVAQPSLATPDSVSAALPAGTLIDVPFVAQSEALCGGAAAAMVLRYWGSDARAEEFASLLTPDGTGIRTGDLAQAVRARGLRTLAFEGDSEELRRQVERGRPVIALLRVGRGRYHYVVVVGWVADDRGGSVVYHDPAVSSHRLAPLARFRKAWEGADRWTLLAVPSEEKDPAPADGEANGATEREAAAARRVPDRGPPGCSERVAGAVEEARAGRLETAARELEALWPFCGEDADLLRELAGVRLRQGRADEAIELARAALRVDPRDLHVRRTLAAALYVEGNETAALGTWNRAGLARIRGISVEGPDRTRARFVLRLTGLAPGSDLSPGRLATARRRLELLPSASAVRVDYRPVPGGRVDVRAGILERPLLPTAVPSMAARGVQAALGDRLEVAVASPTGRGELWRLAWTWRETRPEASLSLQVPGALGLPWIAEVSGFWKRETFAGGAGAERRGMEVAAESWAASWLRWRVETGAERWSPRADDADDGELRFRLGGRIETRWFGDRLSVGGSTTAWLGGAAPPGLSGDVRVAARSRASRRKTLLAARAGFAAADPRLSPLLWPGAGAGGGRPFLLRAHPLYREGILAGPAFGTALAHGGVEVVRWTRPHPALRVGPAAFLDVAGVTAGPEGGRPLHADAGAGVRVASGERGGVFRVDVARGLTDGAVAVSVGWQTPWPGP